MNEQTLCLIIFTSFFWIPHLLTGVTCDYIVKDSSSKSMRKWLGRFMILNIGLVFLYSTIFAFADNGTSGYVTIPYDNNTTSYYDDIFPSDNNTMNYYGTYTIPWKDLIPNNCTIGASIGVQINSGQEEGEQFQILTIKEVNKIRDDIKLIKKHLNIEEK